MRYLFGIRSDSGAGAIRGIAEEHVLVQKYEKGSFDFLELDTKFVGLCGEAGIDLNDEKVKKERNSLASFGEVIDQNFKYKKEEHHTIVRMRILA